MSRPIMRAVLGSAAAIAALSGPALQQPLQALPQIYLAPFYTATDRLNPNGRPLGTVLAWAHGTTGTARRCGPSQDPQPAQPLNQYLLPSGTSTSDVGLPAMEPLLRQGVVIVATDYQGLGGPGRHQYGQAISNGIDVINSLRAARDFRPAAAGERAVVVGWSQGAAAALAAAGLGDYLAGKDAAAPVSIAGFVAMAPEDVGITIPVSLNSEASATAFLQSFNRRFAGNVSNFAHMAMFYWGLAAAQPGLDLGDLFTTQAAAELDAILQRKCMHELSASLSYSYGNSFAAMLKAQPSNALAWVQGMRRLSQSTAPMAPVVIYWGNNDIVVPPEMHRLYAEAACRRGAVISRIELPGNNTHFTTPAASQPLYLPWIQDRFAGRPVASGCPTS